MRKGEIWFINLDPTLGAEIRKTRPAVIVSEDEVGILPLRIIAPITDWKERYAGAFYSAAWRSEQRTGGSHIECNPSCDWGRMNVSDAIRLKRAVRQFKPEPLSG